MENNQTAYVPAGAGMVKVVGILMIIFGALGTISSIMGKVGITVLRTLFYNIPETESVLGTYNLSITLSILGSIILLVAGIIAVTTAKTPGKGGIQFIFGILALISSVIPSIISMVSLSKLNSLVSEIAAAEYGVPMGVPSVGGLTIVGLILNAVLPVLLIVGALKNKKSV